MKRRCIIEEAEGRIIEVTSATVVYAIERLLRYYVLPNARRIRRRAEIKTSGIFERNMNDECQRQLHTVEEARV
ncbi:hypothetical protein T03_197 [Trichinella britovi]|uniref:Uncharacterized protein n=1 Tax=Trichinella britovi TaxID=45882 RepID=A0A0V1CQF1_TRIBR|nr:hypothetical protein T06_4483 [Trichinella sp. T6]KRY51498.1 hypothetical protein T03_197 [Trichinella britovi]